MDLSFQAGRFSKLFSIGLLLSAMVLASCGSNSKPKSTGNQATTHSVPTWLVGNWKPVRLFWGEPVEEFDMVLTITPSRMEYRYPGCFVSGRLVMNPNTVHYSANYYRMFMDTVNCPQQWEIPTFEGQEDYGKIWAEVDKAYLYRISDKFWEPVWIYIPHY
ncbi:MAG: hypothetical protein OEZ04_14230 [Nitrospinota bacterium]|nr:hypothetical protein [Nitrospinota bacterium]